MLRYDSAQFKLVERGIASTCLAASLRKSCKHRMGASFDSQLSRLAAAGFLPSVLRDLSETLLKETRNRAEKSVRIA